MFNPAHCKTQIEESRKNLLDPDREDSTTLNWYWTSALIYWSEELIKVEKFIEKSENNA